MPRRSDKKLVSPAPGHILFLHCEGLLVEGRRRRLHIYTDDFANIPPKFVSKVNLPVLCNLFMLLSFFFGEVEGGEESSLTINHLHIK